MRVNVDMLKKVVAAVMLFVMMGSAFFVAAPYVMADSANDNVAIADNQDNPDSQDNQSNQDTQGSNDGNDGQNTQENQDNQDAGASSDDVNNENNSPESMEEDVQKIKTSGKAKPVTKINAKGKKRGKAVIKWNISKNADGYRIYRAKSKSGKYRFVKDINSGRKIKYTHKYTNIGKNKNYYYRVWSYKVVGDFKVLTKRKCNDAARNTLRYRKSFRVRATAYSGGGYCANGKRAKVGRIAVDPSVIPLGTWLYVKGYGICQACDTGGAIKGKKIDLYFNGGEKRCSRWGVRGTRVYILK